MNILTARPTALSTFYFLIITGLFVFILYRIYTDDVTYTKYESTECCGSLFCASDFVVVASFHDRPFEYNEEVFINTCKHGCTAQGDRCSGFTFNSYQKMCMLWHKNSFSTPQADGCKYGGHANGDFQRGPVWKTYVKQ